MGIVAGMSGELRGGIIGDMQIKLIEDSNNKVGKHDLKNAWWSLNGYKVVRCRLPVGDYVLANEKIEDVFERKAKRGIPTKMLDFLGTYDVCVDVKNSVNELCQDIQQDHARFKDELVLAQNNGIKLYILVENKGTYLNSKKTIWNENVTCIQDLFKWKNPRAFIFRHGQQLYPNCAKGEWIAKCCITMEKKYGCKFVFCKPDEAAELIVKILQGEYKDA